MIDRASMSRLLEPILRRIDTLLGRGFVVGVDDSTRMQTVKLRVGVDAAGRPKILEGIEHPQPYGFSSVPHPDSEVVVASLKGHRDHAIALVVDDRSHRPTGHAPGEVCIYSSHGQLIHLRADGSILIEVGGSNIEVHDDEVNVTASSRVTLTAGASSIAVEDSGVTITSPSGNATFQ